MEKSKLNRFQYNERIYNYKHGLVNSAENQTIEHSSENEEHIEHALKGTPGSYDYNSNRAKGWEWDDHKYIRKEERADGTIKYIYADGSSRIDDTNKVLGKPMRTAATGGTPGGSYTPPMKKTPNSNPVNPSGNSSYVPTQTNLNNGMNGTPGGSTYRKPVPGTPTGPLGNGVTASQPRDTFKANLQMGQGGTPTGLTGTTKPLSEQGYNLAAGKGTPGGVNGPAIPKNAYAADIWSTLKNAITENGTIQPSAPVAEEPQANPAAGREAAEKAGQATIAEQQKFRTNYINFANAMNSINNLAKDNDTVESDEEFIAKYVAPIEEKYGIPRGFTEYLTSIHDIEEMLNVIEYDPGVAKDFMALSNPAVLRDIKDLVDADVQYSIDNQVNLVRQRQEANKPTSIGEIAANIAANSGNTGTNLADISRQLDDPDTNYMANFALGYAFGYLVRNPEMMEKYPQFFDENGITIGTADNFREFYNLEPKAKELAEIIYNSELQSYNARKQNG